MVRCGSRVVNLNTAVPPPKSVAQQGRIILLYWCAAPQYSRRASSTADVQGGTMHNSSTTAPLWYTGVTIRRYTAAVTMQRDWCNLGYFGQSTTTSSTSTFIFYCCTSTRSTHPKSLHPSKPCHPPATAHTLGRWRWLVQFCHRAERSKPPLKPSCRTTTLPKTWAHNSHLSYQAKSHHPCRNFRRPPTVQRSTTAAAVCSVLIRALDAELCYGECDALHRRSDGFRGVLKDDVSM